MKLCLACKILNLYDVSMMLLLGSGSGVFRSSDVVQVHLYSMHGISCTECSSIKFTVS